MDIKPVIIPERNNIKYNKEWNKCVKLNSPFFVIRKRIKYASIIYDMYPTNFKLSEDSVNKIKNRFKNFENMYPDALKNNYLSATISNESGCIQNIDFSKIEYLSNEIFNIVLNNKNWI